MNLQKFYMGESFDAYDTSERTWKMGAWYSAPMRPTHMESP